MGNDSIDLNKISESDRVGIYLEHLEDSVFLGLLPKRWDKIIKGIKLYIQKLEDENKKLKNMKTLDKF